MNSSARAAVHRTVCSHDCPDACSVLVTVRDGRAVQFRGDPEHPVTRGFLCGKVGAYEETVHAPDRLLRPLARRGAKGGGRFEPITWDDALETIAGKIRVSLDAFGGESLLLYYYAGTMGYVQRYCADALFHRLGATGLRQNICYYGADAGYRAVVGGGYGLDIEDVPHSDAITVWGANIATTQVHLVPFIKEARARGADLCVVDPYRNRTVAMADRWLQVRPGTDTALALGLLHILERDGLVDRSFIDRRTLGYAKLRDDVLPRYAPGRTAAITGIDAGALEESARRLAAAKAPLFKVGIGLGRSSHGAAAVRAICCLAGALGAYERLGGGVLYDSGCEFALDTSPVRRPDWLERPTRTVNMTDLGDALTGWDSPPVSFLYVHGSNPAATAPLQSRVVEGLEREDLFTVVHERFMTDTARRADIVLPAVTFVEAADLYKSYGHLYLQYAGGVIPPLGEARTNLEVIQALGRKLGFEDEWFDLSVEDLVREMLRATDHDNLSGISAERVLSGETLRLNLPRGVSGFRERFNTPSGKLEFHAAHLEREGHPGVVDYLGDPFDDQPERYPLRLITPPAHAFLNSSFCWSERSREKERGEPHCLVNPADAAALVTADLVKGQLSSGDMVELYNDQGSVRVRALVTEDTLPGVVVVEGTWWPRSFEGVRGINVLTSARLTDMGGGSTFHDNRVALRSVDDG